MAEIKITGELAKVINDIKKSSPDRISQATHIPSIKRLPFGLFELDYTTNGGVPYNRISIFWGIESSGKSNAALALVRMSQLLHPDKFQVWIDAEECFDKNWAQACGVDLERLIIHKPVSGEEAAEATLAFIAAVEVDLVVGDSLPAYVPIKELERDVETAEVGGNALLVRRLVNKAVAALATEAAKGHDVALVFINQVRFKIGQMMGNPETMPCGFAPRFFSSLILKFYAKDAIEKAINPDKAAYRDTSVTVTKAKVFVNARNCKFKMAVLNGADAPIGHTNAWSMVNKYLKAYNLLDNTHKDGFALYVDGLNSEPVVYAKAGDIKEAYDTDAEFAHLLHSIIFKAASDQAFYVEDKEEKIQISINNKKAGIEDA